MSGFSAQSVFEEFARQVLIGAKLNLGKRLSEIAPVSTQSVASTSASMPAAAFTDATLSSKSAPSPIASLKSSTLVVTDTASSTAAVQPTIESSATLPSAFVAAAAVPRPDRHIANFSRHDFSSFQLKLNKEAADGYRLADVALTGSDSAEVVLEKLSTPEKYDYLVLREDNFHTMETELNKSSAEGYCLCKQTFR